MGIGISGLLAAQRQLATASHNISNINTEGYTRQRSEQAARLPRFSGNGYIGTGVSVEATVRLANEFLEQQIRASSSKFGEYDAFHALSKQVDDILANPDSGLTPTMESFFSALQEAHDNPSSTPARQVLLTEAKTMTERFKLLDDRFITLNNQVNQELVDLTQEVSDAARSVAELNVAIVQRIGAGQGDLPNDLMDQREVLIKAISEQIDVKVIYQDDGAANLFIGSGQSLVIGGGAAVLSTEINQFNAEDLDIILTKGSTSNNVTNQITGGELQGVVNFKENVLEASRRSLGRVAIAITEEINAQHKLGMTLQESSPGEFNLGGNFFSDLSGAPQVLDGQAFSTGSFSVSITDSRRLTVSDYQLDYDGINLNLTRLSDGTVFSGATYAALNNQINPPGADPQGFSFSTLASVPPAVIPMAGESFLIRPTFSGAANIDVSVNNVLDVALAGPIVSGNVTNADGSAINSGAAEITLPSVANVTDIPLNANGGQITLTYDETLFGGQPNGGGFIVLGSGATPNPSPAVNIAYNPSSEFGGKTFVFDGTGLPLIGNISFTVSGIPDNGDEFFIGDNLKPYDDNRNGLAMLKLQTTKTLENSSTDFQSGYAMIVSDVGTQTHSSEVDLLAQQTLREQAVASREGYSGVNLDEEAADLLKFQQAYQASAKVISAADQMFQTLISSV